MTENVKPNYTSEWQDASEKGDSTTKKKLIYNCADWFQRNFITRTMRDNNEIFVYRDGVYKPDGVTQIKSWVNQVFEYYASRFIESEVIAHVRRMTYSNRTIFDKENSFDVCVKNGVINLKTLEFRDHSWKDYFLTKLPLTYNPNVDCPNIKQFIRDVTTTTYDTSVEKTKRTNIVEMIGHCLIPDYSIQVAVALVGGGANGKSILLTLLQRFLGYENTSSISLHSLEDDTFAKAGLYGKMANIYADLSSKFLEYTGAFKMLTGGDNIHAQKKFKNPFYFRNKAKLIVSANKLPRIVDDSYAFFRRWIIIDFVNQFTEYSIPPRIPVNELLSQLTTQDEMSGLLNLAIVGARRLLENKEFTQIKDVEIVRKEYISRSQPVWDFVENYVDKGDKFVTRENMFNYFRLYAVSRGILISNDWTQSKFTREFKKVIKNYEWIKEGQKMIENVSVRGFKGLEIKQILREDG